MLICAIRTVLIYALVMLSVRIMGKRQISELRPSELVAALLISDLAAVPSDGRYALAAVPPGADTTRHEHAYGAPAPWLH